TLFFLFTSNFLTETVPKSKDMRAAPCLLIVLLCRLVFSLLIFFLNVTLPPHTSPAAHRHHQHQHTPTPTAQTLFTIVAGGAVAGLIAFLVYRFQQNQKRRDLRAASRAV